MPYRFLLLLLFCLPLTGGAFPIQEFPDSTRTDPNTELEQRIAAVFSQIPDFEGVDVAVEAGVVRLSGTVLKVQEADEAVALAQRFDGVVYVVNSIQTDVEVEARVTPALSRIQQYLNNFIAFLPLLGVALVVLLAFMTLAYMVGRLKRPFERFDISPMVRHVVRRLLRMFILLIGLLLVLDILGITSMVGAVLGAAGLAGIALGFAFQDIVENYLAGLLMSIRRPFELNDLIQIGSDLGKVVRLTARELILMTPDGNHVRIPNATVFKSTVYNYTRNPLRRFDFQVGVDVEEDLQQVQRLGLDTLDAMRGVLATPEPTMRIQSLGDSNVVIAFFGWVNQTEADFGKVKSEAIRLVKRALDEAGVLMPEPIYNVRMKMLPEDAKVPPAPAAPAQDSVHEEAARADVEVDTQLDQQIRADLAREDEPNLLEAT